MTNDRKERNQVEIEKTLTDISKRIQRNKIQPPSMFRKRVLALMKERQKAQRRMVFWKTVAVVTLVAAVAVVFGVLHIKTKPFSGKKGVPYAYRLEVNQNTKPEPQYAVFILPETVSFVSKEFGNLSDKKTLRLPLWKLRAIGIQSVPVVFRGSESGDVEIELRLLDQRRMRQSSMEFKIQFSEIVSKSSQPEIYRADENDIETFDSILMKISTEKPKAIDKTEPKKKKKNKSKKRKKRPKRKRQ